MALPLDIRDLISSGAKLRAEREKPIRLAVLIDAEAPDAAVEALREALRPQTSTARLHVEAVVPGDVLVIDDSADVVVALAGPGTTLAPSLARARERMLPTVALACTADRMEVARRLDHPVLDTLADDAPSQLVDALGAWLGDRVSGKRLALAANFPLVRHAVAEESVKSTAFQNAVIGGVMVIPGADMPLMTANQAKMILQIAAAYGQPLGAERIKELAAIVGGAFVFRSVARQALSFVPVLGWAIKAGIGYTGTLAMGYAAVEYFEQGGDVRGLAEKIKEARDRVLASTAARRGRRAAPLGARAYEQSSAPESEQALPPVSGQFELPSETATS